MDFKSTASTIPPQDPNQPNVFTPLYYISFFYFYKQKIRFCLFLLFCDLLKLDFSIFIDNILSIDIKRLKMLNSKQAKQIKSDECNNKYSQMCDNKYEADKSPFENIFDGMKILTLRDIVSFFDLNDKTR